MGEGVSRALAGILSALSSGCVTIGQIAAHMGVHDNKIRSQMWHLKASGRVVATPMPLAEGRTYCSPDTPDQKVPRTRWALADGAPDAPTPLEEERAWQPAPYVNPIRRAALGERVDLSIAPLDHCTGLDFTTRPTPRPRPTREAA